VPHLPRPEPSRCHPPKKRRGGCRPAKGPANREAGSGAPAPIRGRRRREQRQRGPRGTRARKRGQCEHAAERRRQRGIGKGSWRKGRSLRNRHRVVEPSDRPTCVFSKIRNDDSERLIAEESRRASASQVRPARRPLTRNTSPLRMSPGPESSTLERSGIKPPAGASSAPFQTLFKEVLDASLP